METSAAFDGVAFLGERCASLADDVVEVFDRVDMLVDDGFVDKRPERFGGLQFGRIRREKHQPDSSKNLALLALS